MTPKSLIERDKQLKNNWYVICLSKELKSKPLRRILYDLPYVIFRGENSKAVCMPDRCLHRHAQLSKGVLLGNKLACPYHGWVYDSNGQVVNVPSEGPNSENKQLCLKPLPSMEQDGCIWVWLGAGLPTSPQPPFRFPYQDDPRWSKYFMITDFENEVTHLAENFMDVPHTVFVHSGWFRKPSKKKVKITVTTSQGQVLVDYNQPQDKIGFTSRILNPKNEPMIHTDLFIMPNLTRVDYTFGANGFVIISQCSPVGTLKTRVYTAIIYRIGIWTKLLKYFMRFYTRRVIEQDVKIMKIQGDNFKYDMNCNFAGTDADVVHTAIERLREFGVQGDNQAQTYSEKQEKFIWI